MLRRVVSSKFTDLHHQGANALLIEAASTSETSVNFYHTTQRNNPEDSHLYTRRRKNLKFHLTYIYWFWSFVSSPQYAFVAWYLSAGKSLLFTFMSELFGIWE
jgi:hypothetical protein